MTVPSPVIQNGPYAPNGVTVAFPYTFTPWSADEVEVVRINTATGAETVLTGFTPSNTTGAGNAVFDVAPPADAANPLWVRLAPSFEQNIDFANQGNFFPSSHTEGLDKATQEALWLRQRTIRVPFPEAGFTLLPKVRRALTIQGYDAAGDPYNYALGLIPGTVDAGAISYQLAIAGAVQRALSARLLDEFNICDFGAVGGGLQSSAPANMAAFHAAALAVQNAGGGTIVIPPGTYYVGAQSVLAGVFGLGYSYQQVQVCEIDNCTRPVVIRSMGAVIKTIDGLHFGSFNPTTGAVYNPAMPFVNFDYRADIGTMFLFRNCACVVFDGALELDGNIANQVIGGLWGDTGRQVAHTGCYFDKCKMLGLRNVHAHHFGLDGVILSQSDLTPVVAATIRDVDDRPVYMENVRSLYNGRQGLSMVGALGFLAVSCDFSHTMQNGVVSSAPGAGVDIEAETFNRRGRFLRCRFQDNGGPGVIADSGDSEDFEFEHCLITGEHTWALWPAKPRFRFTQCTINGPIVNCYAASELDATRFTRCRFVHDITRTVGAAIYAQPSDLSGATFVVFDQCVWTLGSMAPPICAAGAGGTRWNNSYISTSCAADFFLKGRFTGYNEVVYTGAGHWDDGGPGQSVVYGWVNVNGTLGALAKFSRPLPTLGLSLFGSDGIAYGYGSVVRGLSGPAANTDRIAYGLAALAPGDIVTNSAPGALAVGAPGIAAWQLKAAGNPATAGDWEALYRFGRDANVWAPGAFTPKRNPATGDTLAQTQDALVTLVTALRAGGLIS